MTRYFFLNDDLEKSFKNQNPHTKSIKHKKIKFSGGESHVKITENLKELVNNTEDIIFVTKLRNSDDIIDLAIVVDVVDRLAIGCRLHLFIAYLPGSIQDKVCVEGEVLSSSVYANIINNIFNWNSIQFIDAHSDVMSFFSNSINNHTFVKKSIKELDLDDFTLVSPDAGANKKILSLAYFLNNDENLPNVDIIRADKHRDVKTGEILETIVYANDLTNKDCVIVDDICDDGKTFIELSKVLKSKGARNVILIVTHGIFSKGFDVVLEHIDQIVTTNSFVDLKNDNGGNITIIGLNESFYL